MYGYVRPNKSELRVKEFELYRAAYCGLCETLRRRYGPLSRFIVNYDFTFLAMVWMGSASPRRLRCPVHPFQKRICVASCRALDLAAAQSVILTWWKLKDSVTDKPFFPSIPARLGMLLLRRSYRKAASALPSFAEFTAGKLRELSVLEKQNCDSLDQTADCFASILAAAGDSGEGTPDDRIRRELFYHIGRSVYILDAVDDLEDDRREGNYNPFLLRYHPSPDGLSASEREEIRATLNLSQRAASAALSLREEDEWQPILENIVTIGLPDVTSLVLSGRWRDRKKTAPELISIHRG